MTVSGSPENFFQSLIEHSTDLILLLDQGANIRYASPSAQGALGCSPEMLLQKSLFDLVHPVDSERLRSDLSLPEAENASSPVLCCRLRHADLSWRAFEGSLSRLHADPAVRGNPEGSARGTVLGIALYLRDVTHRRRAEEALQRSLNELARSNAFIAALSQVAERITTTTNPDQVMETLGRELDRFGLTCAVMLLDPEAYLLSLQYISIKPAILALVEHQTGLALQGMRINISPTHRMASAATLNPEASPQNAQARQAEFYPDIIPYLSGILRQIPPKMVARAVRMTGIAPFTPLVCLPLRVRDRILGDLSVWGRSLHEDDIKPLSVFANQVAGTIDKAILLDTIQRRAQETETLREAAAVVTSALDLDQVLDRILTELERVIPYDRASVFLFEGDRLIVTACHGFANPGEVVGQVFPVENSLFQEALQRKKPIILADAQADPRFHGWCDTHTTRGWMGIPLIVRDVSIGYLNLDSQRVAAYGPEKEALAQAFANQAAIAIENARLYKQAQHLAITDSLTGLYNRRHFFEVASREFERSLRYGHTLSLLMWDVDHFKLVNDNFGHIAGDQVLQAITQRCRDQLREADILGRYGGEEFVALLPETNLERARQAAGRLCQAISSLPFIIDSRPVSVSISLGVAELDETCAGLEALLDRADQALYLAKRTGRNGVASWSCP